MKPFQPVILLCLLALACSPIVDNRGYVRDDSIKEQIKIGRDSQDDVRSVLGSPSAVSSYGQEAWYYISSRKETMAFLAPAVVEQEVVRIGFDEGGLVSSIDSYSQDDMKDIAISGRETPTEGHEMGVMEQLLGNVGRFNQSKESGTAGSASRKR